MFTKEYVLSVIERDEKFIEDKSKQAHLSKQEIYELDMAHNTLKRARKWLLKNNKKETK